MGKESRGWSIIIEGNPRPKQRPRVIHKDGKTWAYTPRATRDWENAVIAAALEQVGPLKLEGDLEIEAIFYRRTRHRVDVDNLIKSLIDGLMGARVFLDDSQIARSVMEIRYDRNRPRAEVIIRLAETAPTRDKVRRRTLHVSGSLLYLR